MKANFKTFLPILAATILATATPSLANAATQDGDMCGTSNFTTDTKFKCSNLFQGQRLTVAEIYQQGYRVVSTTINQGFTIIVIEKQK